MLQSPVIPDPSLDARPERKVYRVGTLSYTKAGLLVVGAWLLWGDFCLMLMESVVPSIIPLKLKSLGASDAMIGFVVSTIPSVMGMTICPYISFKSDRHRGRWGRRIPFIVWTMPFLCASIVLLGLSEDISAWMQTHFTAVAQFAPTTVTIALIAVFMAVFQFFNMFVGSVFWYLFNDVYPAQYVGRLFGALRVVGAASVTVYNYFIFQYAESHTRHIFIGAAALYFVGLGLMCLKVREGSYPPIEGETERESRGVRAISTFLRESFTHPFYWLLFLATAFSGVVGAISVFQVFFFKNMGLSLKQIGDYNAYIGIAAFAATYFSAIYIDRWHPLRVSAYLSVFAIIPVFINWVWAFVDFPSDLFFWLFLSTSLLATFQIALSGAAGQPRDMRVFPRSRYGQFSSAQGVLRAFGVLVAGVLAGIFIDGVKWASDGSDFAYRLIFIWQTIFTVVIAIVSVMAYQRWYTLGGDTHYRPPAPWSPELSEEMPSVPAVGPQSWWLNLSLALFNATMIASLVGAAIFALVLRARGVQQAFNWFAWVLVPASLLGWIWWMSVSRSIRHDMDRARNFQSLRNGIPHHGILVVIAIQAILTIVLWVIQVVVSIRLGQQVSAIVFGAANVITNLMLIGGVQLMARVERGHLTKLDEIIVPKTETDVL